MRRGLSFAIGTALLALMILPGSVLFAVQSSPKSSLTSNTANWYYSQQATDILNHIQTLAARARQELEPLQVQEVGLSWQVQADMLDRAKHDVNMMGSDLLQLEKMKGQLEPWQENLISRITPMVHEMVYQLDEAIAQINQYQDPVRLSLTEYPQNVALFCKNAGDITGTAGTFNQYVHAEQEMAALQRKIAPARS